jgi:hypothetical protein
MPPVNHVASSTDVDNEATAELPVLDVAAYESALEDPIANTDTFRVPPAADGTVQIPALSAEAIPTLRAAEPPAPYDLDHSGTHEMPALLTPNKVLKATPAVLPAPAAPPVRATTAPITLPPSPPMIEELRNAVAAAERRIEELNERARIADAERAVAIARANAENAQLREQLGLHLEALHTARERLGVQSADQPGIDDELFARADRIAALERELASQAVLLDQKIAALESSRQQYAALDRDALNLRAALARRDAQIAVLEADLAARQQHETSMQLRLRDALAAMDPHVPQLRSEIAAYDEQILTLKGTLAAAQAVAAEKDADLQVAEESIRNLEIEVRDKTTKLEEANVTVEEWRAVIAESQRSILQRDSRIQQLETDLEKRLATAVDSAAQTGEEVALEGPARVLIRTDGNTEFLHVLGRRTRIGRGSDNELVLDTKHISRYHAVLLAGPVHTSIEDLNSTNGVFVNGKRVARQVLKDGDRVTIGRTQFRYTVRS